MRRQKAAVSGGRSKVGLAKTVEPIREPLQARSRETMDKILTALEALLKEKPFDQITIAELGRKSGTSVSSIYARFADKHALILAMHGRVRDEVLECLEELAAPTRWKDSSVDEVVGAVIPRVILFYRKHELLLRAALFIDASVVRSRQVAVLHSASEKFTTVFATRNPGAAKAIARAMDASVRIVASVMYATIMFGSVQIGRAAVTDRELARQLTTAVSCLLSKALDEGGR